MKKNLLCLMLMLLSACTPILDQPIRKGNELPSASNGYRGILMTESWGNYLDYMEKTCAPYGGLDRFSIYETNSRCGVIGCDFMTVTKGYSCRGAQENIEVRDQTPPATKLSNQKPSLDESKLKCAELGFKAGSEAFGNCVLKLSK